MKSYVVVFFKLWPSNRREHDADEDRMQGFRPDLGASHNFETKVLNRVGLILGSRCLSEGSGRE